MGRMRDESRKEKKTDAPCFEQANIFVATLFGNRGEWSGNWPVSWMCYMHSHILFSLGSQTGPALTGIQAHCLVLLNKERIKSLPFDRSFFKCLLDLYCLHKGTHTRVSPWFSRHSERSPPLVLYQLGFDTFVAENRTCWDRVLSHTDTHTKTNGHSSRSGYWHKVYLCGYLGC